MAVTAGISIMSFVDWTSLNVFPDKIVPVDSK